MPDSAATWTEIPVAGRTCWCCEPPEPSPHGYVAIYLHSSRGERLSERPAVLAALAKRGLRVICPMTGPSWWVDRGGSDDADGPTAERLVIDNVTRLASERWGAEPPQLALVGVGMGGQGALRIAYKRPRMFPVVAAVAPTLDFHHRMADGDPVLRSLYRDVEQARQDTAILHVHPLNWVRHQWFCADSADYESWNAADRLRMKLASMGIPFECDLETTTAEDGGSYVDQMAEPAVDFLARALERERLRVV